MNPADLLTFDASAELRKLAEATLEGRWQAPAELVRRAWAAGAGRVEVSVARGRIVVRDDGPPIAAVRVRALEVLLDTTLPAAERHRALVDLEPEPELLAVAALHARRVEVEPRPQGNTLTIDGADVDLAQVRRWLRSCARFADRELVVDGAPVPRGFPHAIAEVALEPPLVGRLAVTGEETAHVWLLSAGVISSHLTLPDTPAFEAAIDVAPASGVRTPAALREAVEPHLGALVDQAIRVMLGVAARRTDLADADHRFLRAQLIAAARRGFRRSDVFRTALFPARVGPEGRRQVRSSLVELGHGRPVPCLEPGVSPDDFLLPDGPVLVLDAEERGRLAQLLKVRFHPVERRRTHVGWRARLHRVRRAVYAAARDGVRRLRHPTLGSVLAEAALAPEERAFLRAMRGALPPTEAAAARMTDGAAPVRKTGDGWRFPRANVEVRRAVRVLAADPAWAYVARLALAEAGEAPDATAAWRARLDNVSDAGGTRAPIT